MTDITKSPSAGITGPLTALASATFFAVITPIATFVYSAGGNSVTLVLVRLVAVVLLTILIAIILKQMPTIDRRKLPQLIAFALCTFGQGFCYLSSVAYIPVSLAALLLYTWPFMAAIASPLIGEKRPTNFQMICFLGAFAGLALAFAPSLDNLDPRGVILALLAGVFTVGLVLFGRVILQTASPLSVSLYGNAVAMVFAGLFVPIMGGFVLPQTSTGAIALGFICIAFSLAIATQLIALRITKASVAAIIYNMEPVVSIAIAFILLGEILTPPQYMGGVIVLAALLFYSRPPKIFKR